MLIQFCFKNYKSFKDETVLDLSATRMTEFSNRVVKVGGENLLPVAAIYGANASGKSNVYNAFACMTEFVLSSFNYGDEEDKFNAARPKPFMFSNETKDQDTCFEVYFTIPKDKRERVYNYGFCVDKDRITEEWLNSRAKTAREFTAVFYRGEEKDFSGLPEESHRNIESALNKQTLIVSLGAKLRVEECKLVRDWFRSNKLTDFANPITSLFMSRRLPSGFVDDPEVRANVIKYFSTFDETIKDFAIEKIPSDNSDRNGETYKIFAIHQKIDSDETIKIPFEEESAGTLKMFSLYPELQEVLQQGSVFFVDELNARLHPLLVRNFILTFLNPELNKNHAQLVFTLHDVWQLSTKPIKLLRRDEIWFTEKNNNGVSSLYSLAEFVDEDGVKIRKDENYEINYLLGNYGAIPELKAIDVIQEE